MDAVEAIEQDDFAPEHDGDLVATIDEQTIENIKAIEAAHADDDPVHLAKCAECSVAVKYRPNITGTGFFLVDADPDAAFGAGPHGRPVCPNGHGEMAIADDQLPPAAEAFADAQAMLLQAESEAVQRSLPGVFPAFNYAGAFREIVEQAQSVQRLKADYDDAKAEATEAKKSLDKAAELLMKMTLEFERRRKEKPEPDAPSLAAPNAIRCVWNQQHPEDECPLCAESDRGMVERVLGAEVAPLYANSHADQVVEYRTKVDVAETRDAVQEIVYDVHAATIAEWSADDRAAVRAWVADGADFDARPSVLGRPHVTGPAGEQAQCCVACGTVLRTYDSAAEALPASVFVRTDCPGTEVEGHRYPEAKPKRQRRASQEVEEPTAKPKTASKKNSKKK